MVFLPSLQTAHRLGSSSNSLSVSVSRFLVMFLLPAWRSREKVGDGKVFVFCCRNGNAHSPLFCMVTFQGLPSTMEMLF